jgi:hypothetical protein
MWDDLPNEKWTTQAEKVIKTHWDKRWTEQQYCPQLILTSNRQCPRGPLQTRVKEIHLSSTYPRSSESRVKLAGHLNRHNRFFEYFSKAYFDVDSVSGYDDDEAHLSRKAIAKLYNLCKRKIPKWMPIDKALEESYNPSAVALLKAIIDGSCTLSKTVDEAIIEFDPAFQFFELKPYTEGIPNEFEMTKKGNRLFIRRPKRLFPWLKNASMYVGKRKIPRKVRRLIR